jgi:VWFA-related protein
MVKSNGRLALVVLVLTLIAPPAVPQEKQKPAEDLPPPIKVEVNLVNLLASVRDKRGGLISNLNKGDFTVTEDGKAQTIKYFTRETDLPLTIGLLVDVSRSQETLIESEKQASLQFFSEVLRKKDMAFLISFGEEAELEQDFTNTIRLLNRALNGLRISGPAGGLHPGPVPTVGQPRGTVLFDAVYLAAKEKLQSEVGRKAIVLMTDGVDQGSRLKVGDAVEAAQRADAVVYGIYYFDPRAYGGFFGHPSDSDLQRMANETGGHVFKVDRKRTLSDVFKELQDEMRSQYAIGYTPTNEARDGGYRRVEVRVNNKELKVQTRKGYYASRS